MRTIVFIDGQNLYHLAKNAWATGRGGAKTPFDWPSYECAIIVSQDKDFQPAVLLSKTIAQAQGRKLAFESSFPFKAGNVSRRGVPETTWIHIDKSTYDACFDPTDYRPRNI